MNSGKRKAIILGAAGRDFHNFNVYFRNNGEYEVVAFTATQIPYIANRVYPSTLAGADYPNGIPIFPEERLPELIEEYNVTDVFFSYSDVTYEYVMSLGSVAMAKGASFHLLGPKDTMLHSSKPVIAVVGGRTGVGKSTISRYVFSILKSGGWNPVVVRHPMPYGSFDKPIERYQTLTDLLTSDKTIEEIEEYIQHIENGGIVYSGIDYEKVLRSAEKEGDIIIWDGGNNDVSFFKPDYTVTVLDPLRAGDESLYYPGEINVRAANVIVINKVNVATQEDVQTVIENVRKLNPIAKIALTESIISVDKPDLIESKNVLVIEDGPSVTHGGLPDGVGARAARQFGGKLVDPHQYAIGSIKDVYSKFTQIGSIMPALGYSKQQLQELEVSINNVPCDSVLLGTPADLSKIIKINKPVARVKFQAREVGPLSLKDLILSQFKT
jgi:predicted GTPase